MQTNQKILAITAGEPAGIGADICLDLATMDLPCRIVVLGDQSLLQQRAQLLQKSVKIHAFDATRQPEKNTLDVLHIPLRETCVAGQLNPKNSPYVLELLDKAMAGITRGDFAAMVTAPVHKGVINDYFGAEMYFSGHTEYLAAQSDTKQVVMMLAGGGMRVALLTTHLPLRDVADAITPELINSVAKILHADLQQKFGISSPKILLAGLNPHAGENGHLGREELEIMQPTAAKLREQGIQISDPLPADTLFQPHYLQHADAVLAAYHDQGLPVLKYASFGGGVNITLGLPFIRTSVDHGTALDLAGTGKAHSGSLKTAVEMAWQMVQAQNK
ncbi:4-hydroxythreonine-4-phosphate dehydrogenase PdxA [Wielerella bovis]|uniref:4-hydroxythreonine-4-phosphate dehydrogenase PdxA n=1 Tax=Wielerella bovis TaxID=2917790 RepID=UPI0020193265|nr:4-hydroxythreonine-4-phosphate dehydrogenase PdxA [Wielerella bovis]MCG7656163.1 4-hydroxythreonine-4-phosphate dehydrogenase PdxA [Wielerella bovis]MCG7658388.1 4-hydroxythreonine-4-phosphate dehydrogenase PdxA [Wielerella bovis]